MKFTKLVAAIAIIGLAATANAGDNGTLRRDVAQNTEESVDSISKTKSESVNININTGAAADAQGSQAKPVQQPATVVEAQPAEKSKAEAIREERQKAEVGTEQKIVEKLEESRLQEEKARADRLFGNKLDPQPAQPAQQPMQQVVAPVPAPQPVVQEQKASNVTIEKVEIIQPKADPAPIAAAPAVTQAEAPKAEEPAQSSSSWYVGGLLGNMSYNASNVKSNYGLGIGVGTILNERIGIELDYDYANATISDAQTYGAYFHTLDQTSVDGKVKYYLMSGKLKPYVGGEISYITRKYTDNYYNNYGYGTGETTHAVNMGLLGGADFALSDNFLIGAGIDYSFNVMTPDQLNYAQYSLPYGEQELEKISFWTLGITAKFLF